MSKTPITQAVEALILPILDENRLELVDIEYKKEGRDWYLRVFIDKAGGVNLDDCRTVSRQLEDLIDVEDIIPNRYYLEVSSPGLDRPLKKESDFIRFTGKRIQLTVFSPIEGRKKFKGVIRHCANGTLSLEGDGIQVDLPLSNIAKAKLEIEL